MKIAIFATHLGLINRGAETFVIELVKELRKNYEVDVYSSSNECDIKENIKVVNYKLPNWFEAYKLFYQKNKLYRKVADRLHYLVPSIIHQYYFNKSLRSQYFTKLKSYDVLYPNNGIWGVYLAESISKYSQAKIFYTGHGGIGVGENKILLRKLSGYIAISPSSYAWSKKISDKVTFIPNGINVNNFKVVSPRKIGTIKILCVGAFVEFKRLDLLIKAVERIESAHLTLLGAGPLKEDLIALCEEKLKGRFDIREVNYKNIYEDYSNASVFTLPSINEPFGIVYLEAMAAKLPVVAPNDENRRYICENYAFYCEVENSIEYARTLIEAHESIENSNSDQYVKNKYSWEKISKKYGELLLK